VTIAYKQLLRNSFFSLSHHSILEGNQYFPYSTHSCAMDAKEPILAMQV
jgi:hypothetical protein